MEICLKNAVIDPKNKFDFQNKLLYPSFYCFIFGHDLLSLQNQRERITVIDD